MNITIPEWHCRPKDYFYINNIKYNLEDFGEFEHSYGNSSYSEEDAWSCHGGYFSAFDWAPNCPVAIKYNHFDQKTYLQICEYLEQNLKMGYCGDCI